MCDGGGELHHAFATSATSTGQLCAACMLLSAVLGFIVLSGALIYSYGRFNCLNSVPYRCYTYV